MIVMPEPDPGYLIRKIHSGWEVTKWGCDSEPLAVYTVLERARSYRCTGPSRKCHSGGCKHVRLVKWAKKNPERDPYVMVSFERET